MEADTSTTRLFKGVYTLQEDEKSDFLTLFNKIRERLTDGLDKKLRFALGRFNMVYWSKTIDDRLLNYVFTLESLFLSGKSEKKFRLCCYVTSTLSDDSEDNPKDIWNYIEAAYDVRSNIVHGVGIRQGLISVGKGDEKMKIPAVEFADKIEEYTRKSLLRVLEEESVKAFQKNLKNELIRKLGIGLVTEGSVDSS